MARFKLLFGQHIQADPDWEPSEDDKRIAETRGIALRAPSRTYTAPCIVESEVDLVEKCGPEKFQRLGERRGVPRQRSTGQEGEDLDPRGRRVAARKGVPEGIESRTPGDPIPSVAATSPSVAPGGQVAQGFQHTTGGPDGPSSGALPSEDEDEGKDADEGDDEITSPTPMRKTAAKPLPNLDRMNLKDLQEFAEAEEIDLKGATRRDDIIKQIRASRQ